MKDINLVSADIPYGNQSEWNIQNRETNKKDAIWNFLENLSNIISQKAIVAIVCDKSQKCNHEKYNRLEKFQVGKRRIYIIQKT